MRDSRTSRTREVPVSRIRSYNSGESRVSWLSKLWRKLISFLSQDLCNPQDSGEVRILMAGKQECTTKRSLLTYCFLLDCPLSNILRVSKPTRSQRRNPAHHLGHVVFRSVAVAWKPSLWWNESCCAIADVDACNLTGPSVALLHGWPSPRSRTQAFR